jgi:hypothetical protein
MATHLPVAAWRGGLHTWDPQSQVLLHRVPLHAQLDEVPPCLPLLLRLASSPVAVAIVGALAAADISIRSALAGSAVPADPSSAVIVTAAAAHTGALRAAIAAASLAGVAAAGTLAGVAAAGTVAGVVAAGSNVGPYTARATGIPRIAACVRYNGHLLQNATTNLGSGVGMPVTLIAPVEHESCQREHGQELQRPEEDDGVGNTLHQRKGGRHTSDVCGQTCTSSNRLWAGTRRTCSRITR